MASTPTGDASRIAPRFKFETRMRIRIQRGGETVTVGGWARDLSESGIGAFVAETLTTEEEIELEVPFPEGVILNLPARVTRNLGTQYGLMFTALSPQQRKQIQKTMAGKAPLPSPFLPST